MTRTPPDIAAAYAHCARIARDHYENFPVASLLLPRVGPKIVVSASFLVSASGMALLTRLALDSSYVADIMPGMILLGLGIVSNRLGLSARRTHFLLQGLGVVCIAGAVLYAAYGLPPESYGDYAWVQHMVASMAVATGRMAVVLPQGQFDAFLRSEHDTLGKVMQAAKK